MFYNDYNETLGIFKYASAMAKAVLIITLALFAVVRGISGEVFYDKKLELEPGQDAIFIFTTLHRNPIFATQFGLKGEGQNLKRKLIIVTKYHGIECGEDFNSSEGWRYKNRVYFTGNITLGHAWFKITNLDEKDTNIYQVGIREETGPPKYIMYTVELVVERKNETLSPITPFVAKKQAKKETLETNKPTGIWTLWTSAQTKTSARIMAEPIEVDRDPPYRLLISATVVMFAYALHTLYVKTHTNQNHCRKIFHRRGQSP